MVKPLIEIDHIEQTFPLPNREVYVALKDIHLEIAPGEFVTLLGHSGCGKSTLLNIVAGFIRPTKGGVIMSGKQVTAPGPDRMVVFQNYSLLPWKTVYENVQLAIGAVFPDLPKPGRRDRVYQALTQVNLWEARQKYPSQLSGGMKQRVAIARALAVTPQVLLLDEPFGALDALTRGTLQGELMAACQQTDMTCLMVTHDVDEALLLSDRVVMLTNGPAARIGQILRIPFPRPRQRQDVVNHPSYYSLRQQIIDFLHQQKRRSSPLFLSRNQAKTDKITIGYIPLTDCAPLLVAQKQELYRKYGLEEVELSREESWGEMIEGLTSGRLQAAQMLAPLPLALAVGLEGNPPRPLLSTALVLSRNGNGITFSRQLYDKGVTDFPSLKAYIDGTGSKPVFGVVHAASMHNLLLRYELARVGIDPDRDVELVCAPPPQMVYHLQSGHLSGFCVGQPWNNYAVATGIGVLIKTSLNLWDGHNEKVLAVNKEWKQNQPESYLALIKALMTACEHCDNTRHRWELVSLLSQREYLNLDTAIISPGLAHPLQEEPNYHRLHQFYVGQSFYPVPSEGVWMLTQLARWQLTPMPKNWWEVIDEVYDIFSFARAAQELELSDSVPDRRTFTLSDGILFNADEPRTYLEQQSICRSIDFRTIVLT